MGVRYRRAATLPVMAPRDPRLDQVRAVAFDLDDTLCDWSAAIDRALEGLVDDATAQRFRAAIRRHAWLRDDGVVLSRRHWMTMRDPQRFWRIALPEAPNAEIDRLADAYTASLDLSLFDDARPTLDRLSGSVRLAMLSNGPHAVDRASRVGILELFEVALSAPPSTKKPHRDAFDLLVSELDLIPSAVLFVGDDPEEDVLGALDHGMRAAWIDRIDSGWTPPDEVVHLRSLAELPGALGV